MLTIAGAKGGCGRTTVTLTLATALARDGTPTIAVDADRQLPNLNTLAGVDREPTIAALDGDTDVSTVTKQLPGTPGVGIITAQRPNDTVDFAGTLEQLQYDTAEVLVDSPSGAGPDVVDPVSAADQVLIVTTATEGSVRAAETTIDIADRLGTPIAGAVFNRCETVPDELAAELDVDVLGAIPERDEPVNDEDVIDACEGIVATMTDRTTLASGRSIPERPDRMVTGSDVLDRLLGGGAPPGSVVVLEAPPASQAELLIHNLTATRGTLYLSTDRFETTVREAFSIAPVATGDPTIRHLDGESLIGEATTLIEQLPERATLVIDTVDPLEATERSEYVRFLNGVKAQTVDANGLTVLFAQENAIDGTNRVVTEQFADAVLEYQPRPDGDIIELRKFRAEQTPNHSEPVSFDEQLPEELRSFDPVESTQTDS